MTDIEEKIQGSLFGGAIGDHWGSEYEGRAGINSPIGDVARKYGTSGFVVDSVPFALYAASKTKEIGFECHCFQLMS